MVTLVVEQQVQLNRSTEQIDEFGQVLQDALESVGSRFGIYEIMSQTGPLTPACLATQVGTSEGNARVWLDVQAARNCVKRSPSTDLYCA